MKIYLDCWPCFMRQALSGARRAGASEAQQHTVLLETLEQLKALARDATPPEMGNHIHRRVREITGDRDPYREAKREATAAALAMQPRLETVMQEAADPLETAARLAITGNIIDYGAAETFNLDATLERVLGAPFGIDGMAVLRRALERADRVLYLADNAGETVFDRVLIQALGRPVTYAVKASPVLNDATLAEAREAGIHQVAEIVDTGCDAMGAPLELCSQAFRERFDAADLIIAKGQACYETLSEVDAPVLFLLQAKCEVIADDLGVETGAVVAKPSAHLAARFGP
ncbi:damage-control phosphatase ARMT1 family protein [Halorhodospira neutriphila]|uniref:Damage-control phosphatase ARMT1-like metal-binding domain-containing protein n=1 Tax=Halorhodospira neutriphila TaxID=168379 RepID=A0ABS1E522_9GAMM|nr:ARMT1-like domain-containing protein [Halorhodospira neutriphila]MBK1725860.1 hypothetical protein [Halorhodospira neutriphila]